MVVRLVGAATLVDGRWDVRVGPALVDRSHPLAAVEGAFNAVMLQGDAIREITLEGPGAGGIETASAVVADMVTIVGTTGTGFLQNDACWRDARRVCPRATCPRRSTCGWRSPTARACSRSSRSSLAAHGISVARLVQQQGEESATLHIVTHETPAGRLDDALAEIDAPRRDARRRLGAPGDLRPRRRGARVGVTLTLGEGGTPLVPGAAALGAARLRPLAEVGGRKPDRELQGPRHGASRSAARPSAARRGSSAPRRATPPRRPPPTPRAPGCRR